MRLDGVRVFWLASLRLNWRAAPGSMASRSGKVAAMQVASYRVAIAPMANGTAVELPTSQV